MIFLLALKVNAFDVFEVAFAMVNLVPGLLLYQKKEHVALLNRSCNFARTTVAAHIAHIQV